MKKKTPLIIAVVCGLLAVLLVSSYIDRERRSLQEGLEPIKVIVASRPIIKGDRIAKENIAFRAMPKKYVGDRAVSRQEDVELIIGQPVRYNLEKGQPVFWSDIGEEKAGGFSSMISKGERAVTISVSDITGVGGLIQPNDHVDIIGTFDVTDYGAAKEISYDKQTPMNPDEFKEIVKNKMGGEAHTIETQTATITILQNVTVLAAGQSFGNVIPAASGIDEGNSNYNNVTLLVTPQEAEMLIFAQEKGKLTLILRKPDDLEIIENFPKMTDEDIMNQIWPQKLTKERKERIEIIRGKQKDGE